MGKVDALVLNLGNAPEEWHMVVGYPGLYHPVIPTRVGEFIPVELAKVANGDEGCPVRLVKVDEKDADAGAAVLRPLIREQVKALRSDADIPSAQRDAAIDAAENIEE